MRLPISSFQTLLLTLLVGIGLHIGTVFYSLDKFSWCDHYGSESNQSNDNDHTSNKESSMRAQFQPSSSSNNNNNNKNQPLAGPAVPGRSLLPDPSLAWWLDEEEDDWYDRIYSLEDHAKSRNLTTATNANADGTMNLQYSPEAVRKIKYVKNHFNPLCGHYRFDESVMPTVSVVVTYQNEVSGWITTTVQSILARTPPALLEEILLVDDNGLPEELRKVMQVNEQEVADLKLLPKVKVIHNHDREGCARSRLIGAKAAKGEVLMFVDSHIEMIHSTWYQHLVLPILENPYTMAIQTIDIVGDGGLRNYSRNTGAVSFGYFDDSFTFRWEANGFGWDGKNSKERPDHRKPYETPVGPGSLFAMHRDAFWRTGGYDEELYVWGGENIELALKTWMCGGRVVMAPCSRVGHMFRVSKARMKKEWPPKISPTILNKTGVLLKNNNSSSWKTRDTFSRVTTRNNLRVIEIWLGDHPAKPYYYKRMLGKKTLDPVWQRYIDELQTDPAAQKQIKLKKENQCKDFAWFEKHVLMKLTGKRHPWVKHMLNEDINGTVSCGMHRAKKCSHCPEGNGADWCNGDCEWRKAKQVCELKKDGGRDNNAAEQNKGKRKNQMNNRKKGEEKR